MKNSRVKNWIKGAATILVISAVIALAVWLGPTALSRYRLTTAAEAVEEGRYDYAIELLLPELDRNPQDLDLRMQIIGLYENLGNYARMEYLLVRGMREQGGQADLYRMLCDIYVKQDKLMDAVSLLDNLPNPRVKETLDAQRPAPPELSPQPGDYREMLKVSATPGQDESCYITLTGRIPSTQKDLYTGPVPLPQGQSQVLAVSVGADGLVSTWAAGTYKLDDVLEIVGFAEPAIESQARILLDIPEGDITSGQLRSITELIIPEAHAYVTLSDLKWFTGLNKLELYGQNTHADITSLAYLSGLTDLSLSGLGIDSTDLEILGQMVWLERLSLAGNQIATLGNLEKLRSLTSLNLSENSITDITPLSGLLDLTELYVRQNGIEETLPLSGLTKLSVLDMHGNRVRDLQGLSGLKSLMTADLSHNSIASLEPLSGLTKLSELNLSNNKDLYHVDIAADEPAEDGEAGQAQEAGEEAQPVTQLSSLSPLTTLSGLKSLKLDACGLEDLSALAPLTGLQFLSLNDNRLSALTGVEGMVELTELWADRNEIKSLRPLQGMSKLRNLHVEYNKLPSLIAIVELPSLKTVYAFGNNLTESVVFKAPGVTVYKGY